MSYSVLPFVEPARCESLIRDVNDLVREAYTEENARTRRCQVYEFAVEMEAFAFAVHCPGGPESAHLPGFRLEELPGSLAELTRRATEALSLTEGRVLFNVGRYKANCQHVPPHYDGELFDYDPEPGVGNTVHDAIRPSEVAILILRNETRGVGTTLYDAEDKVVDPGAAVGELLRFDNTVYRHAVANTGEFADPARATEPPAADGSPPKPRWIRYTVGWRALDEGYAWRDGEPLRPIRFAEAIAKQEQYMREQWPRQAPVDLARGTFPFPEDYA